MKRLLTAILLFAGMTLIGCSEETALHEPGVYKGDADPLLAKQSDPQHQEQLAERLRAVQTDR